MHTVDSLKQLLSILHDLFLDGIRLLLLGSRSKAALKAENLFLRKQLALYLERKVKPRRANRATRLSLVLLSRLFAWKNALNHCQARDLGSLASKRLSAFLEVQVETTRKAAAASRSAESHS
jgi:hypothetical protein